MPFRPTENGREEADQDQRKGEQDPEEPTGVGRLAGWPEMHRHR